MTHERKLGKQGSAGVATAGVSPASDPNATLGVGKQTLTGAAGPTGAPAPTGPAGQPPVQRKADGDGATGPAGQLPVQRKGDGDGSGSGSGAPSPGGFQSPPPPPQANQDMVSLTVTADGQVVQVYIAPGGVDHTPNVFLFFHGQRANLGIDSKVTPKEDDNVSGNDTAGAAVAQGKSPNTIVLLPQGVRGGGGKEDGGAMPALRGKGNLPKFIDDILAAVAAQVPFKGPDGPIAPKHIALAGHSAGGYQGVHDALRTAGRYADTISDITLMDSSYADSHYQDAQDWIFNSPTPHKTLRIVQSDDQILRSHHTENDPSDPTGKRKIDVIGDPHWLGYFGDGALDTAAKRSRAKMTINHLVQYKPRPTQGKGSNLDDVAADRGNHTGTLQHSQVINAQGQIQCDILVLRSDLGHHEIRDNVMDDAIDSIGQGAAGSDQFGQNQMPYYGRDPNAPHSGNAEHVPGEPEPKPKPKHGKP